MKKLLSCILVLVLALSLCTFVSADEEEAFATVEALQFDRLPEIDGKVFFVSEQKVRVGEYVNVLVDDTLDYDLIG